MTAYISKALMWYIYKTMCIDSAISRGINKRLKAAFFVDKIKNGNKDVFFISVHVLVEG